jgi:hypothetical protein
MTVLSNKRRSRDEVKRNPGSPDFVRGPSGLRTVNAIGEGDQAIVSREK